MTDIGKIIADSYGAHFDAVCRRFGEALEALGYSSVLIHSGSTHDHFEDDQTAVFQVNPLFKSWLPLTTVADCFLHFTPGHRPKLFYYKNSDFWHKSTPFAEQLYSPYFDITVISQRDEVQQFLPKSLTHTAFLGQPIGELKQWGISETYPRALLTRLAYARARKTTYEIACLQTANVLAARGHRAAALAFEHGGTEFEIACAFLQACSQRESELPYNPIVACDENAAVLHYQLLQRHNTSPPRSLLIDAGCEFAGYASDVTRTYARLDNSNSDFRALIDEMEALQQSLCASVQAGVDWRDLHLLAHRLIAEALQSAEIISCSAEEAVDSGVSTVFFPHGLGHLLGLQVHDVGGLLQNPNGGEIPPPVGHPYLRLTRILETGFVVTMEPGIYFIDSLLEQARHDSKAQYINWSRVDSLKVFGGIRIEDNLLVEESGCQNMTREAFAKLG